MKKNQFTDLWTMVREAVENGETMHESWVDDIFKPYILNLNSEKAKILYIDICKVQIASTTVPRIAIQLKTREY